MHRVIALLLSAFLLAACGGSPNPVVVFPASGNGNIAPLRILQGDATLLNFPSALTILGNELFVSDNGVPKAVLVYPASAGGNVAPLRTIQGNLTTMFAPVRLSADAEGNLLVGDSELVLTFAKGSGGNIAPLKVLGDSVNLSSAVVDALLYSS